MTRTQFLALIILTGLIMLWSAWPVADRMVTGGGF